MRDRASGMSGARHTARVPSEFIGREVSLRALAPLWQAARERGLDASRLVENTGYTVEYLQVIHERISWQAFAQFAANLGAVLRDDELVAIGRESVRSPFFRALFVSGRLLFGATDLYRWLLGPNGPTVWLVVAVDTKLYELAPGQLRLEHRMCPGYEASRENQLLVRGVLEGLAPAAGAGPARVTQHELPDGVMFDIHIPQRRGLVGRAARAVSWVFAARSAGEELLRTHIELHDRYVQLQREIEARNRIEREQRRLEEQLRQAQKMEAIGRLAGGVAHDFNNMLTVISSYAALLLRGIPPTDPKRCMTEEIAKAAARAGDLTSQLLAFSRQQIVTPRIVDLNEIVATMDNMLRRILGEDIDLRTITAPALGRIKADPGHLEQVVMNLVVNARDAMPRGGQLTLETSNVELDAATAERRLGVTAGSYVRLAVRDTGIGIDRATLEQIFEPFFTTKGRLGTGLGLATVFGIVKQSGGSIAVDSELGKGTAFDVYLPRFDGVELVTSLPAPTATLRGTETVLLVEDEDQVRTVACGILEQSGYRVLAAGCGQSALQLSSNHSGRIDLLLTDVVMPQLSGSELSERLTVTRRDMKVLYMSGYTDNGVIHQHVANASVALLQKPFTPELLLRKVREVLDAAIPS